MRRSTFLAVFALLSVMLAAPASAVPPYRHGLDIFEPYVDDFSCEFPVQIEYPTHDYVETIFFDQDGDLTKVIRTGHVTVQATNLDTEVSVTRNISGPTIITFEDGEVSTLRALGSWLLEFYPGELGEGDPGGNYFTHGNIVVDFPQDVVAKISGQRESVCDPLS